MMREAASADAPEIVALLHRAYEEYRGALDPPSGALEETESSVRALLDREDALVTVADGRVVGCVFCGLNKKDDSVESAWLHRLAVHPDLRGRGLGSRLTAVAEERALAAGRREMALGVRIALPANHRFYHQLGYHIVAARTHEGYAWPTYYVMQKSLTPLPKTEQRLVEVVPYDPDWPHMFAKAAARLRAIFGDELVAVHHVGSTAIVGIHAKPIIDMLPVVRDIRMADARIPDLIDLGYQPLGEHGIPRRRYFRRLEGNRHTHHLHFFAPGDPEVDRHVDFCAYLNAHPRDAHRYGELKQRLAARHLHDINAYINGKDGLIRELDAKARAWREAQ